MEFKTCSRCGQTFAATTEFFPSCTANPSGLYGQCKTCVTKRNKEYKERTKDRIRQVNAEYRKAHTEQRSEYNRKYLLEHPEDPEVRKARNKEWYEKNAEYAREYTRQYRKDHPEQVAENQRRWQEAHKAEYLAASKQYHEAHREHYADLGRKWSQKNREHIREYWRNRRQEDVGLRINSGMGRSINQTLHGKKGGRHWEDLVGYTVEDLMRHLESRFLPGMTWENHGHYGWHIDHRRPIASFRFTSAEDPDFKECWALDNLQPLWAVDNHRKGAKLDWVPAAYRISEERRGQHGKEQGTEDPDSDQIDFYLREHRRAR